MRARSLAVRAAQAGSAAAAAAIARRHSAAPMLGMVPSFAAVAGLWTSMVPLLSADAQPPSMKHDSRSNRGSLRFTPAAATGLTMVAMALEVLEVGRKA